MSILGSKVAQIELACRYDQALKLALTIIERGSQDELITLFQELRCSRFDESLLAQLVAEIIPALFKPESLAWVLACHLPATAQRCLLLGKFTRFIAAELNRGQVKRGWELADLSVAERRHLWMSLGSHRMFDSPLENQWDAIIFHDPICGVGALDQLSQVAHRSLVPGGAFLAHCPNLKLVRDWLSRIGLTLSDLPLSSPWKTWPSWDDDQLEEWLSARGWRVDILESVRYEFSMTDSSGSFASGHVFRATRCCKHDFALTSVLVIPTGSSYDLRFCLDRILTHTSAPYELLVVQGALSDLTAGDIGICPLRIVLREGHYGFAGAVNRGMDAAQGQQLSILSSDMLVTGGWLERCLETFQDNPEVGIVAPVLRSSMPRDPARKDHRLAGRLSLVPALTDPCLVIKRAVWERIGRLREDFRVGPYELMDYCRRATVAGFQCCRVLDAFVGSPAHPQGLVLKPPTEVTCRTPVEADTEDSAESSSIPFR
jgi:hypothetical protein